MDKATIRTETEAAVAAFLAAGGVVEVIKARKAPKGIMRVKAARGTSFDAVVEREVRTSKTKTPGEINSHIHKRVNSNLLDIFA